MFQKFNLTVFKCKSNNPIYIVKFHRLGHDAMSYRKSPTCQFVNEQKTLQREPIRTEAIEIVPWNCFVDEPVD